MRVVHLVLSLGASEPGQGVLVTDLDSDTTSPCTRALFCRRAMAACRLRASVSRDISSSRCVTVDAETVVVVASGVVVLSAG